MDSNEILELGTSERFVTMDITVKWSLVSGFDKSDICRTWGSFRKEREN